MAKLTLSFKGRVIDVFHIERDKTEIGRNDNCTIPIDSLAIAPVQAVITRNDDQSYLLQAQEEAFPVLVNHEKTEEITLNHGDVIQVGKHTLSFAEDVMDLSADLGPIPANDQLTDEDEPIESDDSKSKSGVLQIMNGDNFGRIIPLNRNMTRIGHAGGDCAMIARREDGYFITFLEGPNPPRINRKPMGNQAQLLTDGDIIDVGGTQMQFHD
ncbi:MAG: FHA domain-containing protein [Candidatus Thiodiazotropha sp. (ex Lucina aurantia)]|nr:FHA domain-containing protein [Candidatus Thiodiazotropha sp. (ex Lucina pensylvanica)]MBT3023704.1 FHA domain-containing protein [Candidatus Thiodiazotropha taylori]MBV2099201.1 FHA domain-containing protein [Candidatus Thiodiazotropha sp. (ex Codakia orbicularis)]MBV2103499.1 FHA domain-containing protein [Candidatus Thiodiazotropha sp. (ex Lucina aurantia)]MBV2118063.1 FHA domain-containing protein [Candidatus Thiodiazotropha sp. (ex Lucina aurantia)]